MGRINRREFVAAAAAAAILAPRADAATPRIRVGICDWSSGASGPDALDAAKAMGLDGVQISPRIDGDRLSYAEPGVQAAYRAKAKETGVAIASLGLTVTNEFPLATDPRADSWLEQSIDAAHELGCRAILLAFFGNGDLTSGKERKQREIDLVVGRLKNAAPRARRKRVVLGIESYLSAPELLRIFDRVGSDAVGVYYDIANTTTRGYDVPAEIRLLKGRICEFHFKDYEGPLGTQVALPAIGRAIRDIRYQGWIILEQHHGSDLQGYFCRNAEIVRRLFGLKEKGA